MVDAFIFDTPVAKARRDIWVCGQGIGVVTKVETVAGLVSPAYLDACRRGAAR